MANAMENLKVNETEKQTIETKETVISKLKSKKIKENYDKTAKSQFEKDIINLKEKKHKDQGKSRNESKIKIDNKVNKAAKRMIMLKKNNKSKLYNTLENYFKEKFLLYDDRNQGFLNRKDFSKLIKHMTKQNMSVSEAERFLNFIDSDGNQRVDISELSKFCEKGMLVKKVNRKSWRNKSPLHSVLMNFIEAVEKENAKFFVQDYFEKIWHKFDVDKDNVLNQVEFTNMVKFLTGKDIKKKDAKKFLAYLDKNNDMLAEISEVVNFVLQGMKVDKKDRKKWKRRSSLHIILMEFIETVEHAIFENI